MADQLQNQLRKFLSRSRKRRTTGLQDSGIGTTKKTVSTYRPYKGGVSPQVAAARKDVGTLVGRHDVANAAARYDAAQRKRKRKGY